MFGCFPRLKERLKQSGNTLSGGEQQMLAIARCLMMRPKLNLDEPTEGIMPRLVSQIRREIHRINQSGVSILLVEQNVETALKLCPRVFLMEKGTIVYDGAAQSQVAARDRASLSRAVETAGSAYPEEKKDEERKISRRSFLETALAGGALAGTASLTITKDLFAQASGPIVIGHHCDLTGVISSWGYLARQVRQGRGRHHQQGRRHRRPQGRAGTEDTESNPAPGARKLRNLIQRGNAEFIVGSVHSGVMLAALPIATELKTPYFSTGEATEVTGSKGTRFSFRTGTDTYSIAAEHAVVRREPRQGVDDHLRRLRLGPELNQESKLFIEKAGGKVLTSIPVPLDTKDFVPYVAQIPRARSCCRRSSGRCRLRSTPRKAWVSTRR